MGLLDNLDPSTETGQRFLGLLAAAGPQTDPTKTSYAARLKMAEDGVQEWKQNKLMDEYRQVQMDAAKRHMAQQEAQAKQAAEQQAALGKLFNLTGGGGGFSPAADGVFDGSFKYTQPTPQKLQLNQQAVIDYVRAGGDAKKAQDYADLQNIGMPEVARTIDGQDAQGRPVTYQKDKYGRDVVSPVMQWKAPEYRDTGGEITAIDTITNKPILQLPKTQSPDSKASNALGWANYAVSKANSDRAASEQNKPTFSQEAGGFIYRPDQQNPNGRLVPLAGLQSGGKMTEDQAKAAGWLTQAENAWGNMQKVGIGADGKTVLPAARPGFNDGLASIPSFGVTEALANKFRSNDRQQFMQASSSLSEALLRAATGAGVNKDEAAQKVKELTPVFGDSDEVIKQKFDSVPLYIESLKMRAGPGAAKVQSIMGNRAPSNGVRFLGFE